MQAAAYFRILLPGTNKTCTSFGVINITCIRLIQRFTVPNDLQQLG